MFQLFHANVAKIDLDVVYVVMVVHVCCKCLSQCFICLLYTYVARVSDACPKCFIYLFFCMLQVLHLDISKIDRNVAHVAMVFQLYVPNVSSSLDVSCKGFIWTLRK
jgi:hypothetical protein